MHDAGLIAPLSWCTVLVMVGGCVLFTIIELFCPASRPRYGTTTRSVVNVGLSAVSALVALATLNAGQLDRLAGWGPSTASPLLFGAIVAAGVLFLDLVIYLVHRVSHVVPWLWKLHKVHHCDPEVDVTTSFRHHPLEALIVQISSIALVLALGASLLSFAIFGMLSTALDQFVHSNLRLPDRLDRKLSWVIFTPNRHRLHHSVLAAESNTNFGMLFPWWDRLFGTYRAMPISGQQDVAQLGLAEYMGDPPLAFGRLLLLPLR